MKPTRAALLRDVARTIVASGYAAPLKRPHIRRGTQIAELARDGLLDYPPHSAGSAVLTESVMCRYNVSRSNAHRMIGQARKMREEMVNNGRV